MPTAGSADHRENQARTALGSLGPKVCQGKMVLVPPENRVSLVKWASKDPKAWLVAQAARGKTGRREAQGKTGIMVARGKTELVPLERQGRKESAEKLEDRGCVDQPECREHKESKALLD